MTATPEERALAEDITTPAATLQELAAAHRDLWPAIAAHPNVYPGLLAWMQEYATPSDAEVAAASPDVTADPAAATGAPAAAAVAPRATGRPPVKLLAWIGGSVAAVVLAIVLVMTLVVTPLQRAAEEAAAAELEAAELRTSLEASFDEAVADCERANDDYASALSQANTDLSHDPSSMTEPSLLDTLQKSVAAHGDVAPCVAPTEIPTDNDRVTETTSGIRSEVVRVQKATTGLTTAASAVRKSVQDKLDEAALAAAEQQRQRDSAKLAARTWTLTDPQGYSFTASLSAAAPTTRFTVGDYALGDACGFDPSTDMAVPVTLTVTATTQGFDTKISATTRLTVRRGASTPHEVRIEAYFSDGASCKDSLTRAGTLIESGVNWPESFTNGQKATHRFVVIIRDWRTPATPNGDHAFLDHLELSISSSAQSGYKSESKTVALSALQ